MVHAALQEGVTFPVSSVTTDSSPLGEAFRQVRDQLWRNPDTATSLLEAFAATFGACPQGPPLLDLLGANASFFLGRYDEAERQSLEARRALEALNEGIFVGDADNLLGTIALERGNYDAAAARYAEAARRWERCADRGRLARVHNNLGLVAWRTHDLSQAESHLRTALRLFGEEAAPAVRANLLSNLGLVYEDRGESLAAAAAFRSAIALAEQADDRSILANALSNLADHMEKTGDRSAALDLNRRALGLREALGHARGRVGSRLALGRLALASAEPEAAEVEVRAALATAQEIGLRKHEADAMALMAQIREAQGRWPEALGLERAAARIRQEVQSSQVADRVASLQAHFDAQQTRLLAERAEEENARLQAAMAQLAAASEARGRFLAVLSHEIRTPLTSILGAAELLNAKSEDEGHRRLGRVITTSASALLAIINDVLDFSRIDAGQIELVLEPFSLHALVADVADIVEAQRQAKDIELCLDLSDGLPARLRGDGTRLRQILLNLVSNAIKFTPSGVVTLRAYHDDQGLHTEVIDTGIGVPADLQARLFEPFFQVDATSARRNSGSGLGLTIARQLAIAMGGALSFQSVPAQGTTFRLDLPMQALADPVPAAEAAAAPAPRVRVLIADDDEQIREVLVDLIELVGGDAQAVATGEQAIAAVQAQTFDLALLDLHMPGLDGWSLARELRLLAACPRLVALSGAIDPRAAAQLRASGFDDAVAKPPSLARLEGLLHFDRPASKV